MTLDVKKKSSVDRVSMPVKFLVRHHYEITITK
jgi:hypothetical protein